MLIPLMWCRYYHRAINRHRPTNRFKMIDCKKLRISTNRTKIGTPEMTLPLLNLASIVKNHLRQIKWWWNSMNNVYEVNTSITTISRNYRLAWHNFSKKIRKRAEKSSSCTCCYIFIFSYSYILNPPWNKFTSINCFISGKKSDHGGGGAIAAAIIILLIFKFFVVMSKINSSQ